MESTTARPVGGPACRERDALRRVLIAAAASVVLITAALTAHALDVAEAVWLPLALAAAAVRPVAIAHHRRVTRRDGRGA